MSNSNNKQVFILVWLDKGENDSEKYEVFSRLSVMYRKYNADTLGVAQGTLNNHISRCDKTGVLFVYSNYRVRIVRTTLQSIRTERNESILEKEIDA